jgi:hypothetical protein
LGLLAFGSIFILALAMLLHVRSVRKTFSRINVDQLAEDIASNKREISDIREENEKIRANSEQTKIKIREIEDDLKKIKQESEKYLGIFKTVLYGFDYIVQGCKNALEIEPSEQPEEKQITSEDVNSQKDR